MVTSTKHLVPDVEIVGWLDVRHHDLRTLGGNLTVDHPGVEPARSAAPAEHLDLQWHGLVGEFEQSLAEPGNIRPRKSVAMPNA